MKSTSEIALPTLLPLTGGRFTFSVSLIALCAALVAVEDDSKDSAKKPRVPAADLVNSAGMKLRYIKPGEFVMGSEETERGREDDESPRHRVTLTRGFYLGSTEVTQAQWSAVMKTRPWAEVKSVAKGAKLPAVMISWKDSVEYCKALSRREGRTYRLPTEAEWEYACRAGTGTEFYWGVGFDERYAWSSKNAERRLHEVGTRLPNKWGLFDMGGNAWEWCSDWHGAYPADAVTDPRGPSVGTKRVIRSGSYGNSMWDCRSSERGAVSPETRFGASGFRVVLEVSSKRAPKTESAGDAG